LEARSYRGEERRRRWPGVCPGVERRSDLLVPETDQEPDQSPLIELAAGEIPMQEMDDGRVSADPAA
jgi:hypothetical protein